MFMFEIFKGLLNDLAPTQTCDFTLLTMLLNHYIVGGVGTKIGKKPTF